MAKKGLSYTAAPLSAEKLAQNARNMRRLRGALVGCPDKGRVAATLKMEHRLRKEARKHNAQPARKRATLYRCHRCGQAFYRLDQVVSDLVDNKPIYTCKTCFNKKTR